eukprot:GHRR01032234.1.p1 GENE.GHRR01032234.1~~GHRR01032234.1.p1  ORF type:complete len:122 (-),score=22.60 GHRR01032234.1:145-510(-)
MHSSDSISRLSPCRPINARWAPGTPPWRCRNEARLSWHEGAMLRRPTATAPTRSPWAHRQRARMPASQNTAAAFTRHLIHNFKNLQALPSCSNDIAGCAQRCQTVHRMIEDAWPDLQHDHY